MRKLYGADVCPFVHRARLVLAHKELDHEYVAIDLRNKPDWYDRVLPSGKVPLLEDGDLRLWESLVICDYLEDAYPTPQLLPAEAGPRALVRLWRERMGEKLIPAFYGLLKARDSEGRQRQEEQLLLALDELEQEAFQDGDWLLGKELSLADIALFPWAERWGVLEHYRGLGWPKDRPKLARWKELMEELPAVREIANGDELYIDRYRLYAEDA